MRNILLSLEVILVMGLVATMSGMGYINLTSARRAKNEMHARELMLTLHAAQKAFQSEVQSDRDKDETAEFGTLAELLGLKESISYRKFALFDVQVPREHGPMRNELREALDLPEEEQKEIVIDPNAPKKKKKKKERTGDPKFLYESPAYDRTLNRLVFDGYAFRVFLPQLAADRQDMTEEEKMKMLVDDVEKYWCAFAWPMKHGSSGDFGYFIDFNGKLYKTEDPAISEHLGPNLRAIDAYKGREFTSPVNDATWSLYIPPKPPAPPKKEGDANTDANADANADANVDTTKPQKPKETPEEIEARKEKESKEEAEKRQKLIDEAGVDIEIN